MKKNMTSYKNESTTGKRKVIIGDGEKGKEYGDITKEIENTFMEWLSYANITEKEFARRLKQVPVVIEESINENNEVEINILAGNEKVITPLVFLLNAGGNFDDFLVNVLLLFSYIAGRFTGNDFEKAVKIFADKMIAEKKVQL